jgi:hypothetical protein
MTVIFFPCTATVLGMMNGVQVMLESHPIISDTSVSGFRFSFSFRDGEILVQELNSFSPGTSDGEFVLSDGATTGFGAAAAGGVLPGVAGRRKIDGGRSGAVRFAPGRDGLSSVGGGGVSAAAVGSPPTTTAQVMCPELETRIPISDSEIRNFIGCCSPC